MTPLSHHSWEGGHASRRKPRVTWAMCGPGLRRKKPGFRQGSVGKESRVREGTGRSRRAERQEGSSLETPPGDCAGQPSAGAHSLAEPSDQHSSPSSTCQLSWGQNKGPTAKPESALELKKEMPWRGNPFQSPPRHLQTSLQQPC